MEKVPHFLIEKLNNQYGADITKEILEGYGKRPVTFRINRLKTTVGEIEEELVKQNIKFQKVFWYEDAFIIENNGEEDIRKLSIYQDGKIYLQSLSSMIPVLFLNPKEGTSILDMAAAPGGKTTQLSSIMADKVLITACEKNKIRFERLKYNIEKQGVKKITILNQDARELDDFFSFDSILLDAPCSGSGTLNREDNLEYFKKELLEKTKKTQRELLEKAIKILKSGCEMIYSTCSILEEENELQIKNVLNSNNVEIIPLEQTFDLPLLPSTIPGTIMVKPTNFYEGFFICKLRKK